MGMLDQETTYYDGSTSTMDSGPVPEGKYQAYIVDAKKKFTDKVVNSRNDATVKHQCDLIEVTYEIANGDYAKRKVWSNAIWIFKDPKDGVHAPNPGGNQRYATFLEKVQYPCKEVKIEDSDGNEKLVKELPIEIDINEVIGKPVLIQVKHRTYTNKDGEEKIAANEAGIYDWPDGEVKDMGDDDLPF
tara:strand:+ start:9 stop:572 length:564 start_codon:yes stop_codon:yes gene_type:complete